MESEGTTMLLTILFWSLIGIILILGVLNWHDHPEKRKKSINLKPVPKPTISPAKEKQQTEQPKLMQEAKGTSRNVPEQEKNEPEEQENKEDALDRFKTDFKAAVARGESLAVAFANSFEPVGNDVDIEAAVGELVDMDCGAEDVTAILKSHTYSLKKIAEFLNDKFDPGISKMVNALAQVTDGTPYERAKAIYTALDPIWDFDGDEKELLKAFKRFDCSEAEFVRVLYEQSSLGFAKILGKLLDSFSVDAIVQLAKELNIDLSDSDEYGKLRDGNFDFEKATALLKAYGKDATEILDAENEYDSFDLDSFGEMIQPLAKAGFTKKEILNGAWYANFTDNDTLGKLIAVALDENIPMEDVIAFLREENVDLDEFEEELKKEDVDSKIRIKLLHALHAAEDHGNEST